MVTKKPDMNADMNAVVDRGDSIGLMSPMRLSEDSHDRGAMIWMGAAL
jgi:hypothetical protein